MKCFKNCICYVALCLFTQAQFNCANCANNYYENDFHYESTNIAEPMTQENMETTDNLDKNLFGKNKGPDTIWEHYNNKFLYDFQSSDNKHKQKAQEIVDNDIKNKLHIELKYINLKQCIETALENNFGIKIYEGMKETSKWTYRNSLVKFLPDLYYEYQLRHVEGEYLVGNILPDYINSTPVQSSIHAGWTDANFAKMIFSARALKKNYQSSTSTYEFSKDEIIQNTALEYYNLLGKKLNIEVLRINLKEREHELDLAKGRYNLGVGNKFDIFRAEAQVAQAKQEYIASHNSLRLNQSRLANLMGIDVLEPVYPYEMNINTTNMVDKKLTIDELFCYATKSRKDIKALEKKINALQEEKKALFMDIAPVITASYIHQNVGLLGQSLHGNDTLALIGRVYLGQNLWAGTYTKIKETDAKIYEQNNRLINLKRDIREKILTAYYDSLTAKERIKAAKKEVEAGDEGLKNALVRWDIGENTFLDVLQAQATKTKARQELILSVVAYNKSQINLLFYSGILTTKNILANYKMSEPDNLHNP